ncbi:hypothetical protein LCGC14_2429430 [marine sediment metagenome]|uniref:Uncharacterized protein n=1 Tax=marine sediment metagenome TaxID=412755 RepID=A0A0F9BMI5_9ZZZZ
MPETLVGDSPWQRLLLYVTQALGDKDAGFNFSTGVHLGLAIAIHHPEYAVAMNQAINATGMDIGNPSSRSMADGLVNAVPIELEDAGEGTNVLS